MHERNVHVCNVASVLARVGTTEDQLAVSDRQVVGGLERDTDELGLDQTQRKGVVENSRDGIPAGRRALRQVHRAEAIQAIVRENALRHRAVLHAPKDAVDAVEADRELRYTDRLVRDDEAPEGDGIEELLPCKARNVFSIWPAPARTSREQCYLTEEDAGSVADLLWTRRSNSNCVPCKPHDKA